MVTYAEIPADLLAELTNEEQTNLRDVLNKTEQDQEYELGEQIYTVEYPSEIFEIDTTSYAPRFLQGAEKALDKAKTVIKNQICGLSLTEYEKKLSISYFVSVLTTNFTYPIGVIILLAALLLKRIITRTRNWLCKM